jgi:alpha-mannosidase
MKERDIHLICNAHLDPVWLWQWQEGAAEAISTFRTAAELCQSNDTFIFNHNEVILYKWIQEYDPDLFKQIQKLVKQGKWHIMGGWYLQPDCNMPSGESFVRQILLGRYYFKKHFGVEPKTAINFDPFGHTRGLVQILAKSGYDSYLFGRPDRNCLDLPAEDFNWVGYDGSHIMATRFPGWYNTFLGKAKEIISERLKIDPGRNPMPILWGVGNHGGGPSRIDLRNINQLIRDQRHFAIRHSTPDRFFKQLKKSRKNLIEFAEDLNPWAIGCYASQVRIKQQHRLLENEYYATEKIVTAAMANGLMEYPAGQMHEALCDLMTCQFHDILPGSSIQPVEEAALLQIGHGLEILSRLKAKAFFALASGQKKAAAGTIPIMVLNHHPVKTSQIIECEFNLADFKLTNTFTQIEVYRNGRMVPSQVEKELSNVTTEWRKRIAFAADLDPGQINRFECRPVIIDRKPGPKLNAEDGLIRFKTKELQVIVNCKTGLVDRYRVNGIDYLDNGAFELLALKDNADPWNMLENRYHGKAMPFKLMSPIESAKFSAVCCRRLDSVRVIEDGPVRSIVETVFKYGHSRICMQYKLPKTGTEMEVDIRVDWNEKDTVLKLAVPIKGRSLSYLGQVAYGRQPLPVNGNEAVSQNWSAVISQKENKAFTCINNGTYSSDFKSGLLRLTLLRSPAYSGHPDFKGKLVLPQNRYIERIDQGHREFKFWFNAGRLHERLDAVDTESLVKNQPPFSLSFFPSGKGNPPKPLVLISDDTIQITVVKKAESGSDIILRLFEPTGKIRRAVLSMPVISKKIKLTLMPFEIRTLRVNPQTKKVTQVNLIERPVQGKRESDS